MDVAVVIGSSYGDEGKGLATDFLATRESLVVRFNGGAQAGHTVVDPDGHRHVFHHFGSGTLRGARTFLAQHFIVNPILFAQEMEMLAKWQPRVFVDPDCSVTTPYDMLLNQAAENARGARRHGSCGVGINETVLRNKQERFRLNWGGAIFNAQQRLVDLLIDIRDHYVPKRMNELGIGSLPYLKDEGLIYGFLADVARMRDCTSTLVWSMPFIRKEEHIVFEGAQGLRLDQHSKDFPHVTRSNTGLTNVLEMLETVGFPRILHVNYMTRPYITRHGAGPLSHELPGPPTTSVIDETNIPHQFQGTLRFAEFDLDEFVAAVRHDLTRASSYIQAGICRVQPWLFMTCVDQVGQVPYFAGGERRMTSPDELGFMLRDSIGAPLRRMTVGPTRSDVSGPIE